jgi:hypothetical protein
MLDLESGSIKMKMQRIVKESVKVATDAAIQAEKTMIQTLIVSGFRKYLYMIS